MGVFHWQQWHPQLLELPPPGRASHRVWKPKPLPAQSPCPQETMAHPGTAGKAVSPSDTDTAIGFSF